MASRASTAATNGTHIRLSEALQQPLGGDFSTLSTARSLADATMAGANDATQAILGEMAAARASLLSLVIQQAMLEQYAAGLQHRLLLQKDCSRPHLGTLRIILLVNTPPPLSQ